MKNKEIQNMLTHKDLKEGQKVMICGEFTLKNADFQYADGRGRCLVGSYSDIDNLLANGYLTPIEEGWERYVPDCIFRVKVGDEIRAGRLRGSVKSIEAPVVVLRTIQINGEDEDIVSFWFSTIQHTADFYRPIKKEPVARMLYAHEVCDRARLVVFDTPELAQKYRDMANADEERQ